MCLAVKPKVTTWTVVDHEGKATVKKFGEEYPICPYCGKKWEDHI